MPFCSRCGRQVTDDMNNCPNCGNPLKAAQTPPPYQQPPPAYQQPTYQQPPYQPAPPPSSYLMKSAGIAVLLSIIIPGAGQMYAGRIGRGLVFLFLGIPLAVILAVLFFWLIFPLFLPLAFWIYNVYDAYQLCNEYNHYLAQNGKAPW
jgi:TM2 domain-containing membrane protein YozV